MAIEPPLQLGIDQAIAVALPVVVGCNDSIAERARRRSLVRRVDDDVGVGRVVDRGDLTVADADRLVHDLHHRREAIGGAGRRGQQPVPGGLIAIVVDADDDIERRLILHRRGDDHPADAALEIAVSCSGFRNLPVHSSTISQPRSPQGTSAGVAAALKPMRRFRSDGALVLGRDRLAPTAVDAVELEQMRRRLGAAFQLVHMHDIEPVAATRIARPRITPPQAARSASRPIRPSPLMPTRMF